MTELTLLLRQRLGEHITQQQDRYQESSYTSQIHLDSMNDLSCKLWNRKQFHPEAGKAYLLRILLSLILDANGAPHLHFLHNSRRLLPLPLRPPRFRPRPRLRPQRRLHLPGYNSLPLKTEFFSDIDR